MLKEITTLLSHDLYAEYMQIRREAERNGSPISHQEICTRISRKPAPRFYVTPSTVLRCIVKPLESGKPITAKGLRANMHREIWKRYQELHHLSREQAIQTIITQPAPSYYLGIRQIGKLIYDAVKN